MDYVAHLDRSCFSQTGLHAVTRQPIWIVQKWFIGKIIASLFLKSVKVKYKSRKRNDDLNAFVFQRHRNADPTKVTDVITVS